MVFDRERTAFRRSFFLLPIQILSKSGDVKQVYAPLYRKQAAFAGNFILNLDHDLDRIEEKQACCDTDTLKENSRP